MPENPTTGSRLSVFLFIGIVINAILILYPRQIAHPKINQSVAETQPKPTFPPRIPPAHDSPKWVSIIIVCGNGETNAAREMEPLLKSAILLSSVPLHFHFVTDQGSLNYIQRLFEEVLQYSKKPLRIDTWILKEESVTSFASLIKYNPTYHHSGLWGTSKLMLPWILKDINQAVVVDTDMIFLDDPSRVWDEFYTEDNSWLYKMPLHDTDAPATVCSCIVLLKLAKIRQSNAYPILMEEGLASHPDWKGRNFLYNAPHGDQGLFWAMLKNNETHIAALPERWNAERCRDYHGVLNAESNRPASVIHNNCDFTNSFGAAASYFQFYKEYKWHWLQGDGESSSKYYQVNVTVHAEETKRLQDLFNCLRTNKGNHTKCQS